MKLTLGALRCCFEGAVPSAIATCADDGTPNVSKLSHVHYMDEEHVALSYQFFNKTRENVLANARATVEVIDPDTAAHYHLHLEYLRTETSGPLFENMKARLAGVASHSGMSKVFVLRGADVYRVLDIQAADLGEITQRVVAEHEVDVGGGEQRAGDGALCRGLVGHVLHAAVHARDDDVGARERLTHERHVVVTGRGVEPVRGGGDGFAARQCFHAGVTADRKHRETAARFAHRPFEQRVVASGDDGRPRGYRDRGRPALAGKPRIDLRSRKQQFPGGAHVRDGALADEIVDAPFLEPQIRRDFARAHHFRGVRVGCAPGTSIVVGHGRFSHARRRFQNVASATCRSGSTRGRAFATRPPARRRSAVPA